MGAAQDHLFIYLIVALNAACHPMLICRLKMDRAQKWKFSMIAVAVPAVVMMTMRLVVAGGLIHGRVVDQVAIERAVTTLASALLLAGPVMATAAAVLSSRKHRPAAVVES